MHWRRCGFTLVELVVVLLIVAACITIVFPKLSNGLLGWQRLKSSVSKIASVAEYAHQRAVSTHLMHRLNIDIERGTYEVTAHTTDGKIVSIGDGLSLAGRLPEDIYFSGVEFPDKRIGSEKVVTIEFSPHGWVEPATVYVESSENRKIGVVMHEVLGTVEVLEVVK